MTGEKTQVSVINNDKIMLVDDDIAFLKVAQGILRAKGFDVGVANKGQEALSEINKTAYALVVVDMLLPDMSGIGLLTAINRIQPDIISVILTGYSSVESTVQSLNLGAFAYLEKPLNPDRLLEVIRRGIEKRHLLQENQRLLKELEQRNRDLNILLSISQAVACSLSPDRIIESALDTIAHSLSFEGSYFLEIHSDSINVSGVHGLSNELKEQIKLIDLKRVSLEAVFRENEAVVIHKFQDGDDPLLKLLMQNGYRSLMAVPIAMTKEVDGLMVIATLAEHQFTPLEVSLLKAVVREIAIAITNSHLLEEASSAKALRELDAMRTELLANVSHELRTPLAAIKGFASSLLQPDVTFDDETRQSFIQTIDSEADRLSHLIDDLLLMSRIEAGVFKVRKECYEISEIVDSIKDRLYSIAIKHNLRIMVPDNLPSLMVDGPRIGEVITNLVENAVKYSPEASAINIEVEMRDREIITHVSDKGLGIPKEFQAKVFERFNQLASHNGKRKGSGLGLCICRGIVESHSGKIWVESEPGKGTKFSFSLPFDIEN